MTLGYLRLLSDELTNPIHSTTLRGRQYLPHFAGEETEAKRATLHLAALPQKHNPACFCPLSIRDQLASPHLQGSHFMPLSITVAGLSFDLSWRMQPPPPFGFTSQSVPAAAVKSLRKSLSLSPLCFYILSTGVQMESPMCSYRYRENAFQVVFLTFFWSLMSMASWIHTGIHTRTVCTAAAAKSLQSCPTLCNPIDGSPPGSPVPGILQARTLEWAAISFSSAWKWKVKVKSLSRVRLLATPWTTAHQAPPSMGFSRQEYWSGVLLPSPVCTVLQPILLVILPFIEDSECTEWFIFVNLSYLRLYDNPMMKVLSPPFYSWENWGSDTEELVWWRSWDSKPDQSGSKVPFCFPLSAWGPELLLFYLLRWRLGFTFKPPNLGLNCTP